MAKRRGSGEGYPFKVKSGWKIVVTVGWKKDGKRITKTKTLPTRADVLAWAAQLKAERDASQTVASGMLFCDWVESFLADTERDKATNTHQRYKDVLERFVVPTLGRIPLLELRPMAFRNLLAELEADYAGTRTLDSVYEVSKTCLMAAVNLELISSNPVSKVSRPNYKRRDIRPFEMDEVWMILVRSRWDRLHALYVTAFSLGLRQGELFGLEWRDIDWSAGTLRVERQAITPRGQLEIKSPKTKAGRRTLDLAKAPGVLEALEDRRKTAMREKLGGCPLVFPGARGCYLRGNTFAKRFWKPLLASCGIEERGLHHARHSFATHALLNGEALHVVSQILGHASPTVTLNTYSHLVGASQGETLGRVSRLFNSTTPPRHPAQTEITLLKSS